MAKDAPSKKTENKEKAKIIEDKTFGLKNKNRSTKVSKFVEQVKAQVQSSGSRTAQKEIQQKELAKKLKKEEEEKQRQEELLMNKPLIVQPKVPFGVDPKSVMCAAFKAGQCAKGDKCKYSHDLNVERKTTKIDMFSDSRRDQETMETWDQSTLENCISKKHDIKTTTDIVCKFFLDAIEQRKYGWFWVCPNGGDSCKYRHALPPGYVLKAIGVPEDVDEEEAISFEDFIETERHNLTKSTPVTKESFMIWKEARKQKLAKDEKPKKLHSGRDIFTSQPDLSLMDDIDAMDDEILMERQHDFYNDTEGITTAKEEAFDEEFFLKENLADLDLE